MISYLGERSRGRLNSTMRSFSKVIRGFRVERFVVGGESLGLVV